MNCPDFLVHKTPCIDVRSPCEYLQGHIPGAINVPLFSDEERALVGTLYKKEGQKAAIELGVKLVGPKLSSLLESVKQAAQGQMEIRVYCFRGGMRSGFVEWFLRFVGFNAAALKGGYKAFRRFVLHTLSQPYTFTVLGGFTGTGKTVLLRQKKEQGEQVLDFEALANHRGSSFGLHPEAAQPSTEHFENRIAMELIRFESGPIWVEDESRLVGRCKIPDGIFAQMKEAPLVLVEKPLEARIEHIMAEYGGLPREYLVACTEKLQKKLGGERTTQITTLIRTGQLQEAISLLLEYYDKCYAHKYSKWSDPR